MPEIKCEYGHKLSVGTDAWVETLTLDQLRYAREAVDKKIKAAEDSPRRTVWQVCRGGIIDAYYREEDYAKAADHLIRIYRESLVSEAVNWIEKPFGYINFERNVPHISPAQVTQFEYDAEWFPVKR